MIVQVSRHDRLISPSIIEVNFNLFSAFHSISQLSSSFDEPTAIVRSEWRGFNAGKNRPGVLDFLIKVVLVPKNLVLLRWEDC